MVIKKRDGLVIVSLFLLIILSFTVLAESVPTPADAFGNLGDFFAGLLKGGASPDKAYILSFVLYYLVLLAIYMEALKFLSFFGGRGEVNGMGKLFAFSAAGLSVIGIFWSEQLTGSSTMELTQKAIAPFGVWGGVAISAFFALVTYFGIRNLDMFKEKIMQPMAVAAAIGVTISGWLLNLPNLMGWGYFLILITLLVGLISSFSKKRKAKSEQTNNDFTNFKSGMHSFDLGNDVREADVEKAIKEKISEEREYDEEVGEEEELAYKLEEWSMKEYIWLTKLKELIDNFSLNAIKAWDDNIAQIKTDILNEESSIKSAEEEKESIDKVRKLVESLEKSIAEKRERVRSLDSLPKVSDDSDIANVLKKLRGQIALENTQLEKSKMLLTIEPPLDESIANNDIKVAESNLEQYKQTYNNFVDVRSNTVNNFLKELMKILKSEERDEYKFTRRTTPFLEALRKIDDKAPDKVKAMAMEWAKKIELFENSLIQKLASGGALEHEINQSVEIYEKLPAIKQTIDEAIQHDQALTEIFKEVKETLEKLGELIKKDIAEKQLEEKRKHEKEMEVKVAEANANLK